MEFSNCQSFFSTLRLKTTRSSNNALTVASITIFLILFLGSFSYLSTYDIRPPVITIATPSNQGYVAGELELEAYVKTYQSIYNVSLSFDNGSTWEELLQCSDDMDEGVFTYEWNTTQVPDGTYFVKVMVTDVYGKTSVSSITLTVDNTDPSLFLLYPSDISTKILSEETLLVVASSDEGSGVSKVRYRIGETLWTDMTPNENDTLYSAKVYPMNYSDGVHTLYLEANDVAGNRKASSYTITIINSPHEKNTQPSNSEDDDQLLSSFSHDPATQRIPCIPAPEEEIVINATLSNESNFDSVMLLYAIDGDWTTHNDSVVMTICSDDGVYTGVIPGQAAKTRIEYYFYYNTTLGKQAVNDNYGNYFSFMVDPVTIAYVLPPANHSWVSGIQTFEWDISSTPPPINISQYIVYLNGTLIAENASVDVPNYLVSITNDTTQLETGKCYNYTIWAINSNNVENVSRVFVYVDNQPPTLNWDINNFANDTWWNTQVAIDVSASDNEQSVDTVWYRIYNVTAGEYVAGHNNVSLSGPDYSTVIDVSSWHSSSDLWYIVDAFVNDTAGNVNSILDALDWLSSSWNYRKNHAINGAPGAGTNYVVNITVHYGSGSDSGNKVYCDSKCRTDFGDIRFTSDDGTTELSYWIQEYHSGDNATFWVRIPDDLSSGSVTIYIYYGNAEATNTSNGEHTFGFFDDFLGASLNLTKWAIEVSGAYSISGGILTMPSNDDTVLFGNSSTFAGDVAVMTSLLGQANSFESHEVLIADNVPANLVAFHGFNSPAPQIDFIVYEDSVWDANEDISVTYAWNSDYHVYMITWEEDSRARLYQDGILISTLTVSEVPDSSPDLWVVLATSGAKSNEDVYYDWVLVRKFVDPEPSHGAWGTEESGEELEKDPRYFRVYSSTPEEGDGGDGDNGGGDSDTATPKYLVLTLLSEIVRSVTSGTRVNVTLSVTDRSGKGIESVNVTINVGNVTTVVGEDMGNGNYHGIIDTSRLSSGSYLIVITATKSDYAETCTSFILTVRPSVLDFAWALLEEPLYIGIIGIVGACAIIGLIVAEKRAHYIRNLLRKYREILHNNYRRRY